MPRLLVPLVLALSLIPLPSSAREAAGGSGGTTNLLAASHHFGLGLGGGLFTGGLSAKAFIGSNMSLQGVVGSWSGARYGRYGYDWFGNGLALNVDVLWEMPQLASNGTVGLNWNAGVGGDVALGNGLVGINGVLGLSLQIKPIPLELTADLRPILFLNQSPGLWWGAGGSVRFFF